MQVGDKTVIIHIVANVRLRHMSDGRILVARSRLCIAELSLILCVYIILTIALNSDCCFN